MKLIISLFFVMGNRMNIIFEYFIQYLILGVPWLLDVISFSITFIGKGEEDPKIKKIEIVLDFVNLLSVRNLI